jgi:hypothetical protein
MHAVVHVAAACVEICKAIEVEDKGKIMKLFKITSNVWPRILLAIVLIAGIFVIAGQSIAPTTPVIVWLLYCLLGAVVIGSTLLLLSIVHLVIGQFILRKGGTDPQWFWFRSEPLGLVQLRERIRAQKQEQESKN